MGRVSTAIVVLCLAFTSGTAAAQGQAASGGWKEVVGPFLVQAGHSSTFRLARAQHPLCFEGACLGDNPHASWGDGQESDLEHQDCATGGLNPIFCVLVGTHTYANPGIYTVRVTYNSTCCLFYTALTTVIVDPDTGPFVHTPLPLEDFTIVSVGDSVASGEGNPEIPVRRVGDPATYYATWEDGHGPTLLGGPNTSPCHRSSKAGPAIAAEAIRDMNPDTNVAFTHLACSGADWGGVVQQIRGLPSTILNQPVDALLMSVGANDTYDPVIPNGDYGGGNFSDAVFRCLEQADCSTDDDLENDLARKFVDLGGHYAAVAAEIDALPNVVTDTYITEYFDPTRDNAGRFGGPITINCTVNLIAPVEWEFLYNSEVRPLNAAVRNAAGLYAWHLVDGIPQGFLNHGYCTGAFAWVVTGQESYANQLDANGTAHPNFDGQTYYADRIARTIFKQTAPRAFFRLSTSQGAAGTWTNRDVTVDMEARNLAGAGAVRMEWTVYRAAPGGGDTLFPLASGAVNETVLYDGACDLIDSAGTPVPCHSELKHQVVLSEEGQYTVNATSFNAWGRRSEGYTPVNIDRTRPTVDFGIAAPPPNPAGWNNTEVLIPYTVRDGLSGVSGPGSGVIRVGPQGPASFTVTDIAGNSNTYNLPVKVDFQAPTTSCNVNPSVIWPPNGKLVPIAAVVTVADTLSGPAGFVLTSVTSSEPGSAGDIQGFVPGTRSTNGWLRASRLGGGSGRVYTLTYTGSDIAGNNSTCVARVTVPHDMSSR